MPRVRLKVQHLGRITEEDATIGGSKPSALLASAQEYLVPRNKGKPYEKRTHLLAVQPLEELPSPADVPHVQRR